MSDKGLILSLPTTTYWPGWRVVLSALTAVGLIALILMYVLQVASSTKLVVALVPVCIGIGFILSRLFNTKDSADLLSDFQRLFLTDEQVLLITSNSGEVLSQNYISESILGPEPDLKKILSSGTDDVEALIYRLIQDANKIQKSEYACRQTESFQCVIVRPTFSGNYLWQFVDKGFNLSTEVSDEIAQIRRNKDGAIVWTNPAAEALLLTNDPSIIAFLQEETPKPDMMFRLDDDPEKQFRASVIRRNDGVEDILFLPCDQDEISSWLADHFLDDLPVALVRIKADGAIDYINTAALNLLGDHATAGVNISTVIEGMGRSFKERLAETMRGREQGRNEVARGRSDDREVFLQVSLSRIVRDGEAFVLAVLNDATELKTLEAQFVQSQKMQAVGQLAGGVAHDFNNLLTAINGHCDLMLLRHDSSDTDHADLMQIRQNANRAAALVRQLLAFSRKQTLRPKTLHLFDTLSELTHLLNRLLGEKVKLTITHDPDLFPVRVDNRQLEQVVMNLVVNARDAMPEGGVVHLTTHSEVLEEDLLRDRATVPMGKYAVIEVSDTGVGIQQDRIAKVFEPFYTTKKVGEGTGLGLSTAYGIVKQTGGFIFVDSTVNVGTTFKIYLPAYLEEASGDPVETVVVEADVQVTDLSGRGVVLLVEDEAPVRSFGARALQLRGYTVLEAESGEQALEILSDETLHIDLFVSDVVMPGLDGPSWVKIARKGRPEVPTIFVSGYAEDSFKDGNSEIPNAKFLAKPFTLNELTENVKATLVEFA